MNASNWIALGSAVAAAFSAFSAWKSMNTAQTTSETNEQMSKSANQIAAAANEISQKALDTNWEMSRSANQIAAAANEISQKALTLNESTFATNVNMFQRQFIFELHKTWERIHDVSQETPDTEDAIKGANALTLTAAIWLHDVMDKTILHQTYGSSYIELYQSLDRIDKVLPGTTKRGRDLITDAIRTVYNQMQAKNEVPGSSLKANS